MTWLTFCPSRCGGSTVLSTSGPSRGLLFFRSKPPTSRQSARILGWTLIRPVFRPIRGELNLRRVRLPSAITPVHWATNRFGIDPHELSSPLQSFSLDQPLSPSRRGTGAASLPHFFFPAGHRLPTAVAGQPSRWNRSGGQEGEALETLITRVQRSYDLLEHQLTGRTAQCFQTPGSTCSNAGFASAARQTVGVSLLPTNQTGVDSGRVRKKKKREKTPSPHIAILRATLAGVFS